MVILLTTLVIFQKYLSKKNEEDLELFAFYDPVTELPNRRLFNDRLEQEIKHCKQDGHALAVLFIDLDDFKKNK